MGVRTPSVRPMTPADVAAVADLEVEALPTHGPRQCSSRNWRS